MKFRICLCGTRMSFQKSKLTLSWFTNIPFPCLFAHCHSKTLRSQADSTGSRWWKFSPVIQRLLCLYCKVCMSTPLAVLSQYPYSTAPSHSMCSVSSGTWHNTSAFPSSDTELFWEPISNLSAWCRTQDNTARTDGVGRWAHWLGIIYLIHSHNLPCHSPQSSHIPQRTIKQTRLKHSTWEFNAVCHWLLVWRPWQCPKQPVSSQCSWAYPQQHCWHTGGS